MTAGISFFAAGADEDVLLDYLGEPDDVCLFPFHPMSIKSPRFVSRSEMDMWQSFDILDPALGDVTVVRPPGDAFETSEAKTAAANKTALIMTINWHALEPGRGQGLVDWDKTPDVFWNRGSEDAVTLAHGNIGSQATNMASVSDDYRKWVNRTMAWVRRTGEKVWDPLKGHESPYNIDLNIVSVVYALPEAVARFKAGGKAGAASATTSAHVDRRRLERGQPGNKHRTPHHPHRLRPRPRWGRGPICGGGPTGVCSARRAEVGPGKQHKSARETTHVRPGKQYLVAPTGFEPALLA